MIINNILNTNLVKFFYHINRNFTKIVSQLYSIKKVMYKKITSTKKLVKSEIFIYNKTYEHPKILFKKKKI